MAMTDSPNVAVVDASVVMKWFLPEPLRPEAVSLLDNHRAGRVILAAPPHLAAEVAAALTKRVRRGHLSAQQASEAFSYFESYAPTTLTPPGLVASAMQLALAHQQSVYDCLYLALALEMRCDLITADARFHASLSVMYPFIRALQAEPRG